MVKIKGNSVIARTPSGKCERALISANDNLYQRFVNIRTQVLDNLALRQQRRNDTIADGQHLQTVHSIIDRLIPDDKLANLSALEIFVLLCAVYLHDIGKIRDPDETSGQHHSESGRDAIVKFSSEIGLEEPEALSIAYIVEGHGIQEIGRLSEKTGVAPYGSIRIRYLAALLRLADDLDMSFTRAPRIAQSLVSPGVSIEGKWSLRQCVHNVEIDPCSWYIEVQAVPKSIQEKVMISREVDIINARLIDGRKYLRATPDIGLYYSFVELRLDYFFLRKVGDPVQSVPERAMSSIELPPNAVIVLLRYDPVSVLLYRETVEPTILELGFSPILVDNLPPEESLLDRTIEVIEKCDSTLAILSGNGGSSVYFRLGLAIGLKKRIVAFTSSGTTTIGDMCGLDVRIFDSDEDLKKQIINHLTKKKD